MKEGYRASKVLQAGSRTHRTTPLQTYDIFNEKKKKRITPRAKLRLEELCPGIET